MKDFAGGRSPTNLPHSCLPARCFARFPRYSSYRHIHDCRSCIWLGATGKTPGLGIGGAPSFGDICQVGGKILLLAVVRIESTFSPTARGSVGLGGNPNLHFYAIFFCFRSATLSFWHKHFTSQPPPHVPCEKDIFVLSGGQFYL
jgi:hypothetical protein